MGDIRYALRQLRRAPALTATIVLSLALGIGANTAIFSLIDGVLLSALPVKHANELVMLAWGGDQWPTGLNQSGADAPREEGYRLGSFSLPYPFFEQLHANPGSAAAVFGFAPLGTGRENTTVVVDGESTRVDGEMVAGDYFTGLGVSPLIGRAITADEGRMRIGSAVISYRFWQARFAGSPAAAGRRIFVDGVPFTIVGIMPPTFVGAEPGRTPDIWVPALDTPELTPWNYRPADAPSLMRADKYWWLPVMVRARPGVDAARIRAEIEPRFQQFVGGALGLSPGSREMPHMLARPAVRGNDRFTRAYQRPLGVLMAVVALVLLIACANVATLLLARATARGREIAIRLSVGASRARIVRQLLTESIVTALAGGALGTVLASWGAHLLVVLLPSDRQPDIAAGRLSLGVLAFTAGISVLTGVLFGLAPALRATRLDVAADLKPSIGGGRRYGASGNGFVVAQIALSLVLLFGAGLFIRTLVELEHEQLGVDPHNLLTAAVDATQNGYSGPRLPQLYMTLLERLGALPGVRSATATRLALLTGWVSNGPIAIAGDAPKPTGMTIYWNAVGPAFGETMGLHLRFGRPIGWEDLRGGRRVVVINEEAVAYFFGAANPLGRTLSFASTPNAADAYEIVGVIQNAKYGSVRGPMERTAYVPFTAMPATLAGLTFELRTAADPASLVQGVRRAVHDVDAGLALTNTRTVTEQIDQSLWQERLFAQLMTAFGALAIALASIGLYGTMSYAVARQTREIGVRMAMGARSGQVLRMVLGGALRLTVIGVAVGLPATIGAGRLVSSQLFGVTAADPATLAMATTALVALMAAAGLLPARRAARVDPMVALRAD